MFIVHLPPVAHANIVYMALCINLQPMMYLPAELHVCKILKAEVYFKK